MRGIRFARNRVHHQWADAIVFMASQPYKNVPMIRETTTWCATDDLPPGDPEHPDPGGEQVYRKRLEGGLVRESLEALVRAFKTVARLLEADATPIDP